jgi:hypothetical protein
MTPITNAALPAATPPEIASPDMPRVSGGNPSQLDADFTTWTLFKATADLVRLSKEHPELIAGEREYIASAAAALNDAYARLDRAMKEAAQ